MEEFETKKRGILSRAYELSTRGTGTLSSYKGLPRRMITFTMDHTACLPGVFDADFEVTLGGLTPDIESRAINQSKGEPTMMAMNFAKLSIMSVDGEPITEGDGKDDWFWNAIGPAGRQIVIGMFARIGTADGEAMGKAEATVKIH